MKTNKNIADRNFEISAEFSRYLFEHSEFAAQLPQDGEIILLPEFDTELKEHNLKLGKKIESKGDKVVYIVIKKIRPKHLSRIYDVGMAASGAYR